MNRGVSLLPNHWIDGEQDGRLISGLREYPLDERVEQRVNQEMTRSLNAFHQLLDAIEHKRIG